MHTQEFVILVDKQDVEIGIMEKMEAHQKGILHRAFSVFLFNQKGELLLQQRAADKYHSPLKWTNTCCSHQKQNESTLAAAKRRLMEEMGIQCDVSLAYSFIYKADVGQGLTEHEFDYVLIGQYDNLDILFNPDEVADYKYVSMEWIEKELTTNPDIFTKWFVITFNDLKKQLNRQS